MRMPGFAKTVRPGICSLYLMEIIHIAFRR